ncbi:DUF6524 family protein [Candidatus Venteria ishoeyi]|uniref:DUF6524 family protein n=1 Tax=Candidatus Venteria ishoeyi TaxID=1899563 RepID=UPI0025A502CA|nr:DUF6524 family protein [Candidatus Venteria ishoeyi]MDM8547332.1 DUF6524 family protein [Candidatus Venteria ishoeyi]
MTRSSFPWREYLFRIFLAFFLVFVTYNPLGFSYFHWLYTETFHVSTFKIFIGISLLIAWVAFVYATARSLGKWGILLALIFFIVLVMLFVGDINTLAQNPLILQYTIILVTSLLLGTGVAWNIIWRWFSGMYEKHDNLVE